MPLLIMTLFDVINLVSFFRNCLRDNLCQMLLHSVCGNLLQACMLHIASRHGFGDLLVDKHIRLQNKAVRHHQSQINVDI